MAYVYFCNAYRDQEDYFSKEYPIDIVDSRTGRQIRIREWCEENCEKSVFIDTRHNSGQTRFYFSTREDAIGFKLAWGEFVV